MKFQKFDVEQADATERNCENALQRFRDLPISLADVKEGGGGLFYTEFKRSGQVLVWSP